MTDVNDYLGPVTAFYVPLLLALILLASVIWFTIAIFATPGKRRKRIRTAAKCIAITAVLIFALQYWTNARVRSNASDCKKASSDSGHYTAELCLLQWNPGDDSEYLGRVYDSRNGELLVERTFSTPVPQLSWWKDENVSFSRGGDEASLVTLPPSLLDRLRARLP